MCPCVIRVNASAVATLGDVQCVQCLLCCRVLCLSCGKDTLTLGERERDRATLMAVLMVRDCLTCFFC